MTQFEGILTNVDRRLQLYAMTDVGTFNQRAVTSLDSETFFSAFQDYDPKGSGILRPDEIPVAMGAAVSLFSQRMNTKRIYCMKTNKKQRVYPQHSLSMGGESTCENRRPPRPHYIFVRSHLFDTNTRKTKTPRRKSGIVSGFGAPARGAEGVRAHHKLNEEKILAHRRYGLKDEDI